MSKRGFYEIILVFFLIIVLIVSILFMLQAAGGSAVLYAAVKKSTAGPRDAAVVKDALLACHRIDYLDADLFTEPCKAKEMHKGFTITQYEMNDCPPTSWDYTTGEFTQSIPFTVTVQQPGSSKKCLARLEVKLGGQS